ncbi:MAG: general secretion pathway protein GspB [Planctomycetales bacterium]|nr:general secretion pathway protein GspB [Planctomycetales bacterium]
MPQNRPSETTDPAGQSQPAAPAATKPPLSQRLCTDPSACVSAPAVCTTRPMPLPKTAIPSGKQTGPGISSQIKKAVFGSAKGSMDMRQKKMAVLVGVLSAVFGVVLFVTLGGLGKGSAIAAAASADAGAPASAAEKKTVEEWKAPQPLPADLRNAAAPAVSQTDHTQPQEQTPTEAAKAGNPVVRGILFSRQKPSAIINNQVLTEGQTLDGVTIVRITRETVEFEANGKRWTQSVQR